MDFVQAPGLPLPAGHYSQAVVTRSGLVFVSGTAPHDPASGQIVGTTIQDAWTHSLAGVRQALDADTSADRAMVLRAATTELASTRDDVIQVATTRLELPRKAATEAYDLAEVYEGNPRSLWGYVQGLTRLSQRTPWQDGRFALDRAASRLLTTVH